MYLYYIIEKNTVCKKGECTCMLNTKHIAIEMANQRKITYDTLFNYNFTDTQGTNLLSIAKKPS